MRIFVDNISVCLHALFSVCFYVLALIRLVGIFVYNKSVYQHVLFSKF